MRDIREMRDNSRDNINNNNRDVSNFTVKSRKYSCDTSRGNS